MKFCCVVILTLFAASGWPQSKNPSAGARARLRQVADTYRNLNTFERTAILTTSTDSGDFKTRSIPVEGLFRRPHSMRVELRDRDIPPDDTLAVTNGGSVWLYYRRLNGFCRPNSDQYLQSIPHLSTLSLARSLPYEGILDGLKSARLIGNSVVRIGAADVACVVVTAFYAPLKSAWTGAVHTAPITYWIDEKTNMVVQQTFQTTIRLPAEINPAPIPRPQLSSDTDSTPN